MKTAFKLLGLLAALALAFLTGFLASATGAGQTADPASLSDRERAFTERMKDVVLVGHFTLEGQGNRERQKERYEISKVTKLDGNRWRFDVRLQYMSVDAELPVVVPIEWAGDTPMVSITDFAIPGLGVEFGARVLFHDKRYSGTWDHGEYGGLMFGSIERRSD